MSDESPTPPATAAPAKDASADVTSAPADAAAGTPERRPFWVGLDQPFAVGFAVTLGGLAAILLGLEFAVVATLARWHALADGRAEDADETREPTYEQARGFISG